MAIIDSEVQGMETEKILLALQERDRWLEREFEVRKELKTLPREQKREKREELERIREQVSYYEALTKDMKKSVQPTKIPHLLNSLIHW